MRKKAYTLIELIVVLSISLILLTTTIKIGSSIKKIKAFIEINNAISEVTNTLSYGKYYCRKFEKRGMIYIYSTEGKIRFVDESNGKVIKEIKLSDGLKFGDNMELSINNMGNIKSDSISIMDKKENYFKISISTGVDTINVYRIY